MNDEELANVEQTNSVLPVNGRASWKGLVRSGHSQSTALHVDISGLASDQADLGKPISGGPVAKVEAAAALGYALADGRVNEAH
jgi:hypothetical protein